MLAFTPMSVSFDEPVGGNDGILVQSGRRGEPNADMLI
jgi:hypothetical protein